MKHEEFELVKNIFKAINEIPGYKAKLKICGNFEKQIPFIEIMHISNESRRTLSVCFS